MGSRQVREKYEGYRIIRESTAHDLAGRLRMPNQARYCPGPPGVGQAVLVEEAVQNLLSLTAQNLASWSRQYSNIEWDSWLHAFRFTSTDVNGFIYRGLSITPGTSYTHAVEMRADVPCSLNISLSDVTNSTSLASTSCAVTTDWAQFSVSAQVPANCTDLRAYIGGQLTFTAGEVVYIRNVLIINKPHPLSFTPSFRAAEQLIVPSDGLTPGSFAVEWMMELTPVARRIITGQFPRYMTIFRGATQVLSVYHRDNGDTITVSVGSTQLHVNIANLSSNWHRFGLHAEGNDYVLVANAVELGRLTPNSLPVDMGSHIIFGSFRIPTDPHPANTKFADLRLSYAKPAVLASATAPAPYVEGETIRCVRFDGPSGYEVVG